jgi:hypothetical protein
MILLLLLLCGGTRKDIRDLAPLEKTHFVDTVRSLRANGTYQELAQLHTKAFPYVHNNNYFPWWHRWFVSHTEQVTCLTLPYWVGYDLAGVEDLVGPLQAQGCVANYSPCVLRSFNPTIKPWSQNQIETLVRSPAREFEQSFESLFHASVHRMIGGDMGSRRSANDPVFLLWHSNVDRVLTLWQQSHPNESVFEASGRLPFSAVSVTGVVTAFSSYIYYI